MNLQYLESFPNTFKKIDFIKKKKKELKSPMDFVATFIVCIHVFHIHIFSITLIVGHRRKPRPICIRSSPIREGVMRTPDRGLKRYKSDSV